MKRAFNIGDTDGCCGVKQIRDFSEEPDHWYEYDYEAEDATLEEVYQELYNDFEDLEKGYIYQIWFVKQKDFNNNFNENFEAEELRQLVMNRPNVRTLGSTTNPNSGNIIEGYQWIA